MNVKKIVFLDFYCLFFLPAIIFLKDLPSHSQSEHEEKGQKTYQETSNETGEIKKEIKKTIGRNWNYIQPCIDGFAIKHPDEKEIIITIFLYGEKGSSEIQVKTVPSDENAQKCFVDGLNKMPIIQPEGKVSLTFRIDLPEKLFPVANNQPKKDWQAKTIASSSFSVPVGKGRMYLIGNEVVGPFKLKSHLIKFEVSKKAAQKSRACTVGGWVMQITGPLLNLGGVLLLSFGINALINELDYSWAKPFTIAGSVMIVAGLVFDITGGVLVLKGWSYLGAAVRLYNSSGPDVPILPAE